MTLDQRPLEDRLRATLARWADEAPEPSGEWLETRRTGLRRRDRGRRLVALVAAAAAMFALVSVAVEDDDSQLEITGRQEFVTAHVAVGEQQGVRVLATVDGAVLVASENDRRLYRIDTETNEVTGDVALALPDSVTAGDGAVFAVIDGPPRLARLDPTSLEVEATTEVPDGAQAVQFVGGRVWVPTDGRTLERFDPRTLAAAPAVPFDPAQGFLSEGAAGLWRTLLGTDTVVRIDTETGQVSDSIQIEGEVRGIAVGEGAVWVGDIANHQVVRIDADSGAVVASIPVGLQPAGLALGDGRLWVTGFHDGTLTEIDTATNEVVSTVLVGYVPGSVAFSDGSVWVALHREAAVVRIDPARIAAAAVRPIELDLHVVDLGGRDLFMRCTGEGGPTVVLEAGGGALGSEWLYVQNALQHTNRVCSYDRAGLGRSDAGPAAPTADDVVDDLHSALTESGERGPYVMVGHGDGGLYVRHFAAQHPELVVGVVLVDAVSPTFVEELMPLLTEEQRRAAEADIRDKPELQGLPETYHQVSADGDLGDLPLIVVSRDPDLGPLETRDAEALWQQHQRAQAELSSRGELVIAKGSGYTIQLSAPEVIVEAVMSVVAAVG
ncbi:MAG: alpha/beta fold hydrolase [Actinomycetota bacterium]